MRRFFLNQAWIKEDQLILQGAEAKHISVVLRLQAGEMVEFFDIENNIYTARLDRTEKDRVLARVIATHKESSASNFPLCLAQCLLKGKKMDMLVQKATELGVECFLPLRSRYCENHGQRERQEERWQRIMIEACKQCGRPTLMRIAPLSALDATDFSVFHHRLVAWEAEKKQALSASFNKEPGSICLLLGPEGGLAEEDMEILKRWKFTAFSLGPLILRAETAALAASTLVRYLSGGLRPPGQ